MQIANTPNDINTGMQVENEKKSAPNLDNADFDRLSMLLDVAWDSNLTVDCCIALLGSDRLTSLNLNTHILCPLLIDFAAIFQRIDTLQDINIS